MAFKLVIQEQFITETGDALSITDISDWTEETRANYAVLLLADYIPADLEKEELVVIAPGDDAVTDDSWLVTIIKDGRVNVTGYAHLIGLSSDTPADDTILYLTDTKAVMKYTAAGGWEAIPIAEQIAAATYVSDVLNLSLLQNANKYKNDLNLIYITQIKNDLAHGSRQNELFYRRTDLDYVNALILGAEYNFGLALYTIYYDIVNNLNTIISTGKIS